MSKIALLPGGFKPPHAGHYNASKWLANNTDADTVIVKVGAGVRDGITREMSLKLWDLYKSADPDSSKIEIRSSKHNSPVKDAYEYIENKDGKGAPEGSTVYLAMGEKEIKTNDQRFANIGKFADPRDITFETKLVPPQAGGISGEDMRGFIMDDDQYSFFENLDKLEGFTLTPEQKEQAWQIVTTPETSEWKPGDPVSFEMWTSDWNLKGFGKEYDNNIRNRENAIAYYRPEKAEDWAFKGYNYVAKKIPGFGGEVEEAVFSKEWWKDNVFSEDLYDPEDKVNDYMRGSEWKAGMPDGPKDDIPRALKYKRGGMYTGGGMGFGGMYENYSREIPLEIMTTPEEQMRGMMGRDSLDGGMLFPYDEVGERSFHMKNCLIPLDIVFITQDKITDIHSDCPPCLEDNCPQHTGVADNVLELPGGYCQQNNINIGDNVQINKTSNVLNVSNLNEDQQTQSGKKKLRVFDFDDTIAETNSKIKIKHSNGEVEILNSEEYAKYQGQPGDKFDFSDFDKVIREAEPIQHIIDLLKKDLSDPTNKVTVLTARMLAYPVRRYLKTLGLDAYVIAVGGVEPERKTNWIADHIENKGYDDVVFIDDSEPNRRAIKALRDKYPGAKIEVYDPTTLNEKIKLNELEDNEIKFFAMHADILKQLNTPNFKAKFIELQQELEGERLEALEYFWDEYLSNLDDSCEIEKSFDKKVNEITVFSQNWWKQQLTEVITETKANTHLTHLEELILTQGQDGFNQAKNFLYELIKNLKGEDNSIKNVSVKWDGAPAIFTGINPDNGQFFVGTKSVFNKEPKINYTSQDIDTNHGHAAGLAKKLKLALQYLPNLGIKGILQGDFMFDNDEVETNDIDGITHYTFKPNTIRYAVEANSELGKQIITANIGIIFHTTYSDLSGGGASFGANISGLSESTNVWFDDAYFKDTTGVLLSSEEESFVLEKINEADSINVDYTKLPLKNLNTYLNSEIRQGEFLDDPSKSFEKFKNWYQQVVDKSIEKVKRPETKEFKKLAGEEKLKIFNSQKENIINIFNISKLLSQAKSIFIAKYDKAVATKHFIDNGDGTLRVTKAEGFVAVDHTENGIKLVDRLEFSRNNFNAGKPGVKK